MLTSIYQQFTHTIKAGGRLREFNFLRKSKSQAIVYDVDVADEKGHRYVFGMQELEGAWKIASGQVPEWAVPAENELRTAIAEHQS